MSSQHTPGNPQVDRIQARLALAGAGGATGPTGPAGAAGAVGGTGATGTAGAAGSVGATGPTGPGTVLTTSGTNGGSVPLTGSPADVVDLAVPVVSGQKVIVTACLTGTGGTVNPAVGFLNTLLLVDSTPLTFSGNSYIVGAANIATSTLVFEVTGLTTGSHNFRMQGSATSSGISVTGGACVIVAQVVNA